jgi:two-component system, OmpR family, response regulator
MRSAPHILVVEDDRDVSTLVARALRSNDMRVSLAANGRTMDKVLNESRIDLVVLDVMLPDEDGLNICRRLRASSNLPIIMLTAKAEDVDRIVGLEMGADDYLTKPFNPRELVARIRSVLRRSLGSLVDAPRNTGNVLTFDGWRLNRHTRQLYNADGARVALTGAEFDLLLVFCERPRRVLRRDQLIDLTQGREANPFDRSIDILVSRMRQKMEKDPKEPVLFQTIRSGGYMFSPEVKSE